jgi:thioredoxin 2
LSVVKVDVDDAPVLAARYGVRSVPTLIVLREGEVVARQVGTVSEPALRRLLAGV